MAYPHICDPESVLFGGTGHFDGMHQIFGGKNLMSKVKYEIDDFGQFTPLNKYGIIWMEQMQTLAEHKSNPIKEQKWLNIEDKTCFFYKHIAINHNVKSPTKRIPSGFNSSISSWSSGDQAPCRSPAIAILRIDRMD